MLQPSILAAAITTPNTVTVKDVEIVQTGIEYPLATGPRTFTTADLSDLVESQSDPAIKAPRLKLGHEASLGILEDGQPAIGTLENLHLEQNGHLVVGDYVGIPEWLANVLPSAYPARSIEAVDGVDTNTGHHWRLVLTDLALLGVVWPGVGTLDDIQALYSEDGPDNIRILTTKEEVEAMARPARGSKLRAQVDAEDIRRQYYDSTGPDQFWWWIRSMFVDPNELIVEDEDTGNLYRVPFETKGDVVTFSDPVAVKVVFKDKPANQQPDKQAAAWMVTQPPPAGRSIAVYANRAESRPDQEEQHVGVTTEVDPVALRNSLGLADDASDEEVRTALASAGFVTQPGHETGSSDDRAPAAEQPGTSATSEPGAPDNTAPAGPTDPAVAQPTETPSTTDDAGTVEPVAASSDTVRLDRTTYNDLRRQAQQGATAFERQEVESRDRILTAAVSEGRIPPSRRSHWEGMLERDPEGATVLLTAAEDKGGLAKGLVPVKARGGENPLEDTTIEAYPADWLPEVKRGGE
jgi:hypothetical protein